MKQILSIEYSISKIIDCCSPTEFCDRMIQERIFTPVPPQTHDRIKKSPVPFWKKDFPSLLVFFPSCQICMFTYRKLT